MPKKIEPYQRTIDLVEEQPRSPLNYTNLGIIVILVLFTLGVGMGTAESFSIRIPVKDNSKVCMVEYAKKGCDTLNLDATCQKLLDCVQMKDQPGLWASTRQLLATLIEEVQENLLLPALGIGFLLFWQLVESFRGNSPRQ